MKIILLACMAAVAVAAPQLGQDQTLRQRPIAILKDERQDLGNGEFFYTFETENGITESRRGYRGSKDQINMEGSYSFPLPDGTFAEVRYVADENGFRAESPLIPTPHPLPAHAIEQIRFAEEQRARGVTWPDY
ncbi:cuticle protein AM1199-like [Palaemon carinicauda]|uniref:cuticle protein AM1199-like n=1 Tax=Palaemon carinicauda TaxID=392227 RepID=UPI0035B640F1